MANKKNSAKPIPVAVAASPSVAVSDVKSPSVIAAKWYIIALAAIAFFVNFRTTSYNYTFDDSLFTSEGTLIGIKGIEAIPALFTHGIQYNFDKSNIGAYRPLIPTSFALEQHFFGFHPGVSHTINLLLFVGAIVALFALLRRMFCSYSIYIPFFIALLYALHPIHTEVIASVKSRDEILALLFTSLALFQSFRYIDRGRGQHLILAGVWFFAAVLSKESPVVLVAIAPFTLYFFTEASLKKIGIALTPYIVVAAIYMTMRAVLLDAPTDKDVIAITDNSIMAAANFGEKLGTILFIELKYIILILFPHPLSYDYSYSQIPIVKLTDIKALAAIAVMGALLVYAGINFRRKSIYAYCILFFFLSIIITSNLLVDIAATMGERFMFTPSLAWCIALVFIIAGLLKASKHALSPMQVPALSATVVVIALLYGVKTMARNEVWQNNFELFKSGTETSPNSWRVNNSLAVEYREMAGRETNEALKKEYLSQAVVYFHRSLVIYGVKADTHADLGALYFTLGNFDSSEMYLLQALKLKPTLASAAANLGTLYMSKGNYASGLEYYNKAIAVQPDNVIAQFNGAVCYYQVKQYDSAIAGFKRSFALAPDYYDHKAPEYIAIVYKTLGAADSAAKYEAIARLRNPAFRI